MIKRLRSRLIVAFLGVSFMATLVIALVPYFALKYRSQQDSAELLQIASRQIFLDNDKRGQEIHNEILIPFAQYIQSCFANNYNLVEDLITAESIDELKELGHLYQIKNKLEKNFTLYWQNKIIWTDDFLLIPKRVYLEMKSWIDDNLLYEEKGQIYWWRFQPLFYGDNAANREIIGGLYVRQLLISKNLDDPSIRPDLYLQGGTYNIRMMFVIHPQPSLLENYIPKEKFDRLFGLEEEGIFNEVDIDRIVIKPDDDRWPEELDEKPVQMKLIPIMNHRRELSAIIVMVMPIYNYLEIIGIPILIGYGVTFFVIAIAATLFARTIARPIRELASASHRMSEGEFETRVRVVGTEEQQLLSSSFNLMADRIQTQIEQLRQKTLELETSNLELGRIQRFLESLLANIRTGVMSIEPDGRISHINRVGINMLNLSVWQGKPVRKVIQEPTLLNLIQASLDMKLPIAQNEIPYETNDGSTLSLQVGTEPLMESGHLTRLVVTFHDLTLIRKLEEQVRRQDRLAALGRMAAGVAHEIRNPLGIISGSAELLHKRFGGLSGEEGLTDFILDEVKRLSRIITEFLILARPPLPTLAEVEVMELFEQVATYMQNQQIEVPYTLSIDIAEDVPSVDVDLDMCHQAFLNLLLNAQDAMPDGGTIYLRARRRSNGEVMIEFCDEGQGIPSDVLDKIFDPFFTSKDTGTGLGLSLVHQIVTSHNGRIEVESDPGQGSVFRLYFPAYETSSHPVSPKVMV